MLTRILLAHTLRTAAFVLGLGVAIGFLVGGSRLAFAVALGGLLSAGSGALLIWLVGILLDPDQGGPSKAVAGVLLTFKLLLVGGVLWWILLSFSPNPLGLFLGIGLGLGSLVVGVNRASSSPEGLAAMEEAAAKIEEKKEDSEDEKR